MYRLFIYISLYLVLLASNFTLFGQFNKYGLPFFKNYTPEDYKGHNEIWSITEDKYGNIFFGTTNGEIIKYDGKNFVTYYTKNKDQVFALTHNTFGNIFVSSYNDFGYLSANNKNNSCQYTSLINEKLNNVSFRKTYADTNQNAYFCSKSNIYIYNKKYGTKKINLPKNSWLSFYINNKIYISNEDSGIIVLENNALKRLKTFHALKGKYINIFSEINSNKSILITSEGESWLFSDGVLNPFRNKLLNTIISDGLYYIEKSSDYLIFCTLSNGVYITDFKFRPVYHLSVNEGLLSNTITYAYYKESDNTLWLASINGLIKIELNPKLHFFSTESGLKGNIIAIDRYNNQLYVGTDDGLFAQSNSLNKVTFKNINLNLKSLSSFNIIKTIISKNDHKVLWLGLLTGIYEKNEKGEIKKISDLSPNHLYQDKLLNKIYVSTEKELYIAQMQNNTWIFTKYPNFSGYITSVTEDDNNNIWLSTKTDGIYRINNDHISHFTDKDGLPTNDNLQITLYNKNILVSCVNGIYSFNNKKNAFERYKAINEIKSLENKHLKNIISGINKQLILFTTNNDIIYIYKQFDHLYADTTSFYRFPFTTVYQTYFDPFGIIWFATNKGIYSYNTNIKFPKYKFRPIVNEVKILKIDSILFNGIFYDSLKGVLLKQPEYQKYKLYYKYNNLQFSFSCPFFHNEDKTEYSYMLEGFDNQWSSWTKDNKVSYTNIDEGKYTFYLKARNCYKQESQVISYQFEIEAPWYRTIWAYIIYVLLTIILFYISIKLYTRKLEADKRKLERIVEERTAEIVRQKNEIENKNKEIEQKNKDITDSIYYARRIQEAILPPIEKINPYFEIFIYYKPKDIVSGDFYFYRHIQRSNVILIAAADCTGHGVPGAFMSVLGTSLLNEIVEKTHIQSTDMVLNELRKNIISSLNPEGKEQETKDGMDITLIAYYYEKQIIEFSGANNPLYFIRNNELIEYKADKMPVGLYERKQDIPFSKAEIQVQKNDLIYIFSDGFSDQFGGEQGKKYLYKRFKEFLTSICHLDMEEQRNAIEKESIRWRGEFEQIDDQIIIGIKFHSCPK